jgi:hypothetical protein
MLAPQRATPWLVASLALAASLAAQPSKPDFSGTWRMDPELSDSIVNGYEPEPVTLVVRHTATDFIVETRRQGESETILYRLDTPRTNQPGDVITSARWEGSMLIALTDRKISDWAVKIEERWQLEEKGLTVQRTVFVQHGYERPDSRERNYSTAKDVFVRVHTPR